MPKIIDWLTIKEAAEHSGYFSNYLRLLCREGKISAYKLAGRIWLIDPASLDNYVARHKANGDPRSGPRK